jgi:hypothetical protein
LGGRIIVKLKSSPIPETQPSLRKGFWTLLGTLLFLVALYFLTPPPVTPPEESTHTFPALQTIELRIDSQALATLERKRAAALSQGVLQEETATGVSPWVKATLLENHNEWKLRLRLKGDWTDHLAGGKWSFRIEVGEGRAWRGLKEFSLQSPERRSFLDEWLFHQVLIQEGVLTPRYDFIFLRLNGEDLGTYAVEEHFTRQLLASQGRLPGPILKFDEDGMWDARVEALRDSGFPYLQIPFQEAATVLPFQRGQTLRDSTQRESFRIANQLLHQFRHGLAPPAEVFDLNATARQYALMDLFSAYHSIIWHNRRFYYDPWASHLEPIVFDAFSGQGHDTYIEGPIWGHAVDGWHLAGGYNDLWGDYPFRDSMFVKGYYRYLKKYASVEYLNGLKQQVSEELRKREAFLRREYWGYRFSWRRLEERAAEIRAYLNLPFPGTAP